VKLKCPWCGSMAGRTPHGKLARHLTPGGQPCFAVGVDFRHAENLRAAYDKQAEINRRLKP